MSHLYRRLTTAKGTSTATGKEYVHYEWSSGGNGGFLEADGESAMAAIDWGDLSTVQSSEVMESRFPLCVEWSRQAMDSGGAGRTRGGLRMRRALRLTDGHASYSLLADGAVVPPFGVHGGETGAPVGSFTRNGSKDTPFATPGKVGGHPMSAGDVIVRQSAGGRGYSDPLERDPTRVLDDVEDGYVSLAAAREVYGVIVSGDALDARATDKQRAALRAARVTLTVGVDANDPYEVVGRGRKRVMRLHPDDARIIGVEEDQMLELLGTSGAPLRRWTRLDRSVEPHAVPLDAHGQAILRIKPGDGLYAHRLSTPILA